MASSSPSVLALKILAAAVANGPDHPSDFHGLYQQLGEPTTLPAFGRCFASLVNRGWAREVRHEAPPQGDGTVTRELIVTDAGRAVLKEAGIPVPPTVH